MNVKRKHGALRFKIYDARKGKFNRARYETVIANRDFNQLACLFSDLETFGYPVEKAVAKWKEMKGNPDLFFL